MHAQLNRRNAYSDKKDQLGRDLRLHCVEGAVWKCVCGATLKTFLDVTLHDPQRCPTKWRHKREERVLAL